MVWFKVEIGSHVTSVEVVDLPKVLRCQPRDLKGIGIDIPIGLFDGSRA
jgi:hypothetical protein